MREKISLYCISRNYGIEPFLELRVVFKDFDLAGNVGSDDDLSFGQAFRLHSV
jgi:hypothetical protein